jgi:hypothetical protein
VSLLAVLFFGQALDFRCLFFCALFFFVFFQTSRSCALIVMFLSLQTVFVCCLDLAL